MHSALILAGFAALVAGSPAPQGVDFFAVAATTVSLTGPPAGAVTQSNVYNTASAALSASQASVTVASASGSAASTAPVTTTAAATAGSKMKRSQFCIFGICFGTPNSSTSTSTSTSTKCSTTTSTTPTTSTTSIATTTSTTSSTSSSVPVTTSSTTGTQSISTTSTATTSSDSTCPTVPEAGTYCGFINPLDDCAIQPDGYGPQVQPDTVAAFLAYPDFQTAANSAVAPAGYVQTFKDLNASVSANTYLGLYTLHSYDTLGCSQWCDNTTTCTGFNMFVERNPSLQPASNCTNPSSITNYKCTLWGSGVSAASATNSGQWRYNFQVVIAGSDGYQKTNNTIPTTPTGWTNPKNCSGKAHNHASTTLGSKFFPGPYDPSVCAAFASAQNAANQKSLGNTLWNLFALFFYDPFKCNFFNSYMLTKDGKPLGTMCNLHAYQWTPTYATYIPGWNSQSYYGVESSWSFCSK